MHRIALALAISGLCPAAIAQDLRPTAAIVSASTYSADSQNEPRFTDPRDKIMATGLFQAVDIIPATNIGDGIGTPTLMDLMPYDAIITWSNSSYADAEALGNVLADYVDAGGGVVVAVFTNTSTTTNRYLTGRWLDVQGGYIAIEPNGGFVQGTPAELGQVPVPGHPILDGVGSFRNLVGIGTNGVPFGAWRVARTDVRAGAELVARWSTGQVLIAVAPNPRVVELGFHPVSNAVNAGYWDQTSDGGRIMANALLFAAGEFDTCQADLTGEGDVNTNDFFLFLSLYQAQDARADFTGEGDINTNDFFAFLAAYQAGC